jgi:HNH endonuclease
MFAMARSRPRYSEAEARVAVAESLSYAEALRRLGMRPAGGNHRTLQKYVELWGISTDHFDPIFAQRRQRRRQVRPLHEILVENSTYSRGSLKRRLYSAGLKQRTCELCGQGEDWRGKRMALILDHINGVATDNRIENLQIVCPNCASTLDTHCGRNLRLIRDRVCEECGSEFRPRTVEQRFCSLYCGRHHERPHTRVPRPETRKVPRPTYEELKRDLSHMTWLAVGRKYGVTDNAVRKWVRWYEREAEAGGDAAAA